MNSFLRKIILASILCLFVFSSTAFAIASPVPSGVTGGIPQNQGKGNDVYCSWRSPTSWFSGCLLQGVASILEIGLRLVSYLITAASAILNIVIGIQNKAFHDQPLVNIGWKLARDVVNIFYILFLLIIAISTILRFASYGMKQLLWKLIISALLVNFSLPIAGVIIDVSNALGNSFYQNMGTITQDGSHDVSATIIKGFQPGKIYQPGPRSALELGGSYERLINIIIALAMGILLEIVAAFVIFAGAFLLVIRIVALWIVLILSPFAFLFWVLPRTSSISNRWFEALFNQSFFYPAYMFFLYLVFKAIDGGVITSLVGGSRLDSNITDSLIQGGSAGASELSSKPELVLGFITLGILLVASLVAAKEMSAHGAGAAIGFGKSAGKSLQGYAGRVANKPVAFASRALVDSKAGRALARIPVLRTALKAPQASIQKADADIKKQVGQLKNLPAKTLAAMLGSRTYSSRAKAEVFQQMDDKKREATIQAMDDKQLATFATDVHSTDRSKKYNEEIAKYTGDIRKAMRLINFSDAPAIYDRKSKETQEYQKLVDQYTADLSEKDLARVKSSTIKDPYFQSAMFKAFGGNDVRRLAMSKENAEAVKEAFENYTRKEGADLKALLNSIVPDDDFEKLKTAGKSAGYMSESQAEERYKINRGMLRWAHNSPGAQLVIVEGQRSSKRDLAMGESPKGTTPSPTSPSPTTP